MFLPHLGECCLDIMLDKGCIWFKTAASTVEAAHLSHLELYRQKALKKDWHQKNMKQREKRQFLQLVFTYQAIFPSHELHPRLRPSGATQLHWKCSGLVCSPQSFNSFLDILGDGRLLNKKYEKHTKECNNIIQHLELEGTVSPKGECRCAIFFLSQSWFLLHLSAVHHL